MKNHLFFLLYLTFLLIKQTLATVEDNIVSWYPLNGTLNEIENRFPPMEEIGSEIELGPDRHGRPNSAYYFTKYLNIIKVPCGAITDLKDFTISLWSKSDPKTKPGAALISIAHPTSNAGNHFTLLNSQFWLSFGEGPGEFFRFLFGKNLFDNDWQHLLITRNSDVGKISIYVNGEFFSDVTGYIEDGSLLYCEGFVLGCDQDSVLGDYEKSQQFYGAVSDLRVYSVGFNETDVKDQYNNDTSCVIENCDTCATHDTCTDCSDGYYLTGGSCLPCTNHGTNCELCDAFFCNQCKDDFILPDCTTNVCPRGQWKDGQTCKDCPTNCAVCSNGTSCDTCNDFTFKNTTGDCQNCVQPCALCNSLTECVTCFKHGFAPPDCDVCDTHFFDHEGDCLFECPSTFYNDYDTKKCEKCADTCIDCETNEYLCTSCPNGKFLYNNNCVTCDEIPGMEQNPNEAQGVCREICGDGYMIPSTFLECDDHNNDNDDGCTSDCKIEPGWICNYNETIQKSQCNDRRPIGFSVIFNADNSYFNIEKQKPISAIVHFNKTFTLPKDTSLTDYIVVRVDGIEQIQIENIELNKIDTFSNSTSNRRNLNETVEIQPQSFEMNIYLAQSIKNRNVEIDFKNKDAFRDTEGNHLSTENTVQKDRVQEYYYYSDHERYITQQAQQGLFLGLILMMALVPIYGFYYRNHFNKFFILFMSLDISQTLYFYRFINVRWPINGVFFFRELKPSIGFYLYNFFKVSNEDNFVTGIEKFDHEGESPLFLNNAGQFIMIVILYAFIYLISVLFTIKKCESKNENSKWRKFTDFVYNLRYGYLEFGVGIDILLFISGPFIFFIYLQMKNSDQQASFYTAIGFALVFVATFSYVFRKIYKNKGNLYSISRHEIQHDIDLKDKLQLSNTFKYRNMWHFIHNISDNPFRAYFFFYFVIRKLYLAIIFIEFYNFPKLQLLLSSFSHIAIIVYAAKEKLFRDRLRDFQLIIGESIVLTGLAFMAKLLEDESEDEHSRLQYSWLVLALFCLALFVHLVFFLYIEIVWPIIQWCLARSKKQKVQDLRQMRREGKQKVSTVPNVNVLSPYDVDDQYSKYISTEQSFRVNEDSSNNIIKSPTKRQRKMLVQTGNSSKQQSKFKNMDDLQSEINTTNQNTSSANALSFFKPKNEVRQNRSTSTQMFSAQDTQLSFSQDRGSSAGSADQLEAKSASDLTYLQSRSSNFSSVQNSRKSRDSGFKKSFAI